MDGGNGGRRLESQRRNTGRRLVGGVGAAGRQAEVGGDVEFARLGGGLGGGEGEAEIFVVGAVVEVEVEAGEVLDLGAVQLDGCAVHGPIGLDDDLLEGLGRDCLDGSVHHVLFLNERKVGSLDANGGRFDNSAGGV